MWTSPNESPQSGACLQHLQGGCAGGGLEKVRVLALCREACPDCCCLAKTAPEKQKTDDGERGEPKGWLVCSFCSVSVFTLEGCRKDMATILCMILHMLQRGVIPPFVPLFCLLYHDSDWTHAVKSNNDSSPFTLHPSAQRQHTHNNPGLVQHLFVSLWN